MLVLGLSGHFSSEDEDLAPDVGGGLFQDAFHDAAACLIRDGELLAAVEEERFNRIKKTTKFPINAVRACLDTAGVSPSQIAAVGHFFTEDLLDQSLNVIYSSQPQLPVRSSRELVTGHLREALGVEVPDERLLFTQHHVAHGMSSYIRSGMRDALIVVMDGRGEKHSITIFHGTNGNLESLATYGLGKSLGGLYLANTRLLGYGIGDEYKVMGLAPYGNAEAYREAFGSLYELRDDGEFTLRGFAPDIRPPRRTGEEFTQAHKDFAAALQEALENIAMHVLCHWSDKTGLKDLCFVGGVAHNSTLNGRIIESGKFREVFVHPVSHDAGAAEGAALTAALHLGVPIFGQPRMRSASVGPALGSTAEVGKELASWGDLIEFEQPPDVVEAAAQLLAGGAVLGWAQGRSEYGPRALGNRSILADARPGDNKHRINAMIKKREAYRPFAPVVTPEAAGDYFDMPDTRANYDFMSFVVKVCEDRRPELGAVTHVDGSARIQIVDPASNKRFYDLVRRFGELTGTPVLLNTSFNNNVEPIVQTTQDAVTCFLTTGLDFLVIDDFVVRRNAGDLFALDNLVPRFRPVTRLVKRVRHTAADRREVRCEISLDHAKGSTMEISTDLFDLLEPADGVRPLSSFAGSGGISQATRHELYTLWQLRFITLRPA
ncbi:carbamoyltransferase C-terminal domain-containing protein [Phytohabitans sp. ZYX-F-186]|uniref:Carbamoyltransferase C-terminal domain-containing protein n=1 Tax=Phytohabitans maris TaxID=3071409 RepID=A0ABU0ZI19_9ACTN|nr:carbamoyltransferase C-terminal domain-containing protein [Phytohabitans sp. ZYX-F-186]MDQ7905945.1 carbamoyltransferase C-terminal domain-containing protein [Phytohabitans sp. ZYX-F-186]